MQIFFFLDILFCIRVSLLPFYWQMCSQYFMQIYTCNYLQSVIIYNL